MNNFFNPFFRYRYPRPQYRIPHNFNNIPLQESAQTTLKNENNEKIDVSENKNTSRANLSNNNPRSSEKPLIEFHGIKLYNDDLLILALIYFLYKEDIHDTLLYMALFALLFS